MKKLDFWRADWFLGLAVALLLLALSVIQPALFALGVPRGRPGKQLPRQAAPATSS